MNIDKGRDLCFQIIEMAKARGVQQCDVILQRDKSFSLQAQAGKIDKTKVTSTQIAGIRVIQDQKLGISASESLDRDSLAMMIDQALVSSRYANVDPYQVIEQKNASDLISVQPGLNREDRASAKEKIDFALRLESSVLNRDPRIRNVPYSGYSDGEGESLYANHLGTFCYQKERSFSCYTSALASHDAVQTMHHASSVARRFEDLALDRCADESASIALALLSAKPLATGRYDIVFQIDAWESLLGSFLGAFSAKSAMEGVAYYREKVGHQVAQSLFSMSDHPRYPGGFSYSEFDDEGVPQQELAVIEQGVLKTLFHNSATARYYKIRNTARAARGPRSSLGTSPTQLVIKPGTTARAQLYAGPVLHVFNLKGLHSGTNAISGHFSLAAEAVLMQDGNVGQYVKDVTLSGNFYQMLEQILAIGAEQHSSSSQTFFSPEIRFGGLSVAGV